MARNSGTSITVVEADYGKICIDGLTLQLRMIETTIEFSSLS